MSLKKLLTEKFAHVVATLLAAALVAMVATLFEVRNAVTQLTVTVERIINPIVSDHESRIRELERQRRAP